MRHSCQNSPEDPTFAMEVELRMWRPDGTAHGTRLIPVAVRATLAELEGRPVLLVEDDDGYPFVYPPEELREWGSGSVLVLSRPTDREARLLAAAAEAGYAVEPRLAGEDVLSLEEL